MKQTTITSLQVNRYNLNAHNLSSENYVTYRNMVQCVLCKNKPGFLLFVCNLLFFPIISCHTTSPASNPLEKIRQWRH